VLTVVKVGGGLAREAGGDALRALCAAIGEAGRRHRLLVVPGGGSFADAVRDCDRVYGLSDAAAHRMAILAMDQFGWLLSELIPGCAAITEIEGDGLRVLLPAAVLADDPLPASWDVTSDSIAAWVAREAGAGRLVLVKPVDGLYREWPPVGAPLARVGVEELSGLGGVDAHLAQVLSVETWVLNGRAPERLVELLERGRTVGTEILGGGAGAAPPPS
jgi:5-(aminomethyl)-3-furanmethanol phosphate kinase